MIWRPAIILSDMGLDTNILTSPANQISDTTALLTLQLEPSARLGALTLGGRASGRASYFERSVYERSIDTDDAVAAAVTGRRASIFGEGNYARTRDRFDPQIYLRTQRTERALRAGGALRLTGKTEIRGSAGESRSNYELAEAFSALGLRLNRRLTTASMALRTAVTRRTSVAVVADLERARFDADQVPSGRDLRVMGGVELMSTALVSGSAYAGYRRLGGLRTSDGDAGAMVGAIDLRLRTGEATQWNIVLARELSRSRLIHAPQLTTRRAGLSMTRRITPRWELIIDGSRQWLDYSGQPGPVALSPATGTSFSFDETTRYAAETIYRLGRSVRVSGRVQYDRLHVIGAPSAYERLRAVSAIEYRF